MSLTLRDMWAAMHLLARGELVVIPANVTAGQRTLRHLTVLPPPKVEGEYDEYDEEVARLSRAVEHALRHWCYEHSEEEIRQFVPAQAGVESWLWKLAQRRTAYTVPETLGEDPDAGRRNGGGLGVY